MNYRISKHAREAMEEREIPADIVDTVFNSPEQIVDGDMGRKIYQSRVTLSVGGLSPRPFLVRLVIVPDTDPTVIVTIVATTNIRRYWRTEDDAI